MCSCCCCCSSNKEERFYIFWRAWKNCAKIKDEDEYGRSIAAFITDMESADSKYRYSIRRELYDLIEISSEPIIRKRAMGLKSLLFS
jgi:hypothetical protein